MAAMAFKASARTSSFAPGPTSSTPLTQNSRSQSTLIGGLRLKNFRTAISTQSTTTKKRDEFRSLSARADASSSSQRQQQQNEMHQALDSLSTVVTDDAVPEGHKGLHGFLYGEGGAEVHGSGSSSLKDFEIRKGEDDGTGMVSYEVYLAPREAHKFAGVFAIYDSEGSVQYVSYSRNVVSSLKNLRGRVGEEKCSSVRVRVYSEASLITRSKMEEEKGRWLEEVAGLAPGNSSEKDLWEGNGANGNGSSLALMSEEERREYEEKKLKMRKAMGENLFDDVAGEDDDARTRRLKFMQAVEGDDWSSVIDGQTQQTLDAPASSNATAAKVKPSKTPTELPAQIVSPFADNLGAQTGGGGLYSADSYELSVANVDMVLEEVRPYLIADGGNVEVVGVTDGIISLRLQGACGTCPSSTSTMKMGIERVLREKFGDAMKDVVQVDKQEIGASIPAVDAHLEMLRPAIRNYGGSVEVVSINTTTGICQVKYQGPPPIGMGIQAAIKDKFPDIKQVELLPVDNLAVNTTGSDTMSVNLPLTDGPSESAPNNSLRSGFESPPLVLWIGLTLAFILLFISAFYPDISLLGPFEIVRRGLYFIAPPKVLQIVAYVAALLHVVEALYALFLAQKFDPSNTSVWFWQTFYMGFFSLYLLMQKEKSKEE